MDPKDDHGSSGCVIVAEPPEGRPEAQTDDAPDGAATEEGPTVGAAGDVEDPVEAPGSADVEDSDAEDSDVEDSDVEDSDVEGPVEVDRPVEVEGSAQVEDPTGPGDVEAAVAVSRRRVPLRRGAAVAAVALVGVLAVSAFSTTVASSAGDADQHFVDTARAQGRVVGGQRTLLVSAARKICDRRANHATVAQRRATALSIDELAAVERTFAGDTRDFTVLALDTYCAD